MDTFDRLRQFDILSHFSDHQIEQLGSCTTRIRYPRGTTVLQEGDTTRDIYLVDLGEVRIQRSTPYGCYSLAHLKAGDSFGETSFIDENARSGDALVTRDAVLFVLGPASVSSITEKDRQFNLALHWALWKSLSDKLRKTNETLARFFSKTGTSRPEGKPRIKSNDIHVGVDAKRQLFREQVLSPMEINFLATLSREQRFQIGRAHV